MRIKDGFMLRKICDNNVVLAFGEAAERFNGMMMLNETGAFLWRALEQETTEDQVIEKMLDTYSGIDKEGAKESLHRFLEQVKFALI